MIRPACDDRLARAALTYLAEPADPLLGDLLRVTDPSDVLASIRAETVPAGLAAIWLRIAPPRSARCWPGGTRVYPPFQRMRWPGMRPAESSSSALTIPGGRTSWMISGAARPLALWVRGTVDLQSSCVQSVAVIGARAATAYGEHVSNEIATVLGENGWTVISGGSNSTKTKGAAGELPASGGP
jgi:DNA processing protein